MLGGKNLGKAFKCVLAFFISPLIILNSAALKKKLSHPSWFYYFLLFAFLVNLGQWQVAFLLDNSWEYYNKVLSLSYYKKLEVKDVPYREIINKQSLANDLDPCLVAAVITQESGFHPQVVSPTGAKGLMQVIPGTWKMLWEKGSIDANYTYQKALEPEANIAVGTKYLKMMMDRYPGKPVLALAAYNAGHGNVDYYQGVPPFNETRQYVKQIVKHWSKLRRDFPCQKILAYPFLEKKFRYLVTFNLSLWALLFFWIYRTRSLFQRY